MPVKRKCERFPGPTDDGPEDTERADRYVWLSRDLRMVGCAGASGLSKASGQDDVEDVGIVFLSLLAASHPLTQSAL